MAGAVGRVRRHPDRAGHRGAVDRLERMRRHEVPDALGRLGGAGQIGLRQDGDELLATPSADRVDPAQRAGHHLAELSQRTIAGVVPIPVVDRLEEIDVDEHEAEAAVVAPRASELGVEDCVQRPVVGQPGDVIGQGLALTFDDQLPVRGQRLEQPHEYSEQRQRRQHDRGHGERVEVVPHDDRQRAEREHGQWSRGRPAAAAGSQPGWGRSPRCEAQGQEPERPQRVGRGAVDVGPGGRLVEVDAVARHDQHQPEAEQRPHPAGAPPVQLQRSDQQRQQHQVADRIGEVGRDLREVPARGRQHAPERDRRGDRDHRQRPDHPVEREALGKAAGSVANLQHQADPGERIEQQVAGVGPGRGRRRGEAGQRHVPVAVTGHPAENPDADQTPRRPLVRDDRRAPQAQHRSGEHRGVADPVRRRRVGG